MFPKGLKGPHRANTKVPRGSDHLTTILAVEKRLLPAAMPMIGERRTVVVWSDVVHILLRQELGVECRLRVPEKNRLSTHSLSALSWRNHRLSVA